MDVMQMTPGDRSAIVNFMKANGPSEFFQELVKIAHDHAEVVKRANEPKAELRQWQRLERKLEELAGWCELFGPGSGCR
jgi:hypothetical protein